MIQAAILASGSSGNAVLVKLDSVAIIIDPGIPAKHLINRCAQFGVQLSDVHSVFCSHIHKDHCNPAAMNALRDAGACIHGPEKNTHQRVTLTGEHCGVMAVSLAHDVPCHGFVVSDILGGNKLGYITDTCTMPCDSLKHYLGCNILIVETNYDPEVLVQSRYNDDLKLRVFDTHLSNQQARELVELLGHSGLKYVFCHHISENSNNRQLVEYEIRQAVDTETTTVILAEKDSPTKMVTVI